MHSCLPLLCCSCPRRLWSQCRVGVRERETMGNNSNRDGSRRGIRRLSLTARREVMRKTREGTSHACKSAATFDIRDMRTCMIVEVNPAGASKVRTSLTLFGAARSLQNRRQHFQVRSHLCRFPFNLSWPEFFPAGVVSRQRACSTRAPAEIRRSFLGSLQPWLPLARYTGGCR